MNKNEYGKALLLSYRYLETLCNAIDKYVLKKSITSSFYENCSPNKYSAYEVSNHIIKLIERKKKIINTKVIIEDCLRELKPLHQRILLLTYLDQMTTEKISFCLNMTKRTFFRKKSEAINSFCKKLAQKGYEKDFIKLELEGENWFDKFCRGAKGKEHLGEVTYKFVSTLIKDLNKFTRFA